MLADVDALVCNSRRAKNLIILFRNLVFKLLFLSGLLLAQGSVSAAPMNIDQLIGYWSFDEGAGSSAADGSLYVNDGVLSGHSWSVGKQNGGVCFGGRSGQHMSAASGSVSNPEAVTLAGWVKPSASENVWGWIAGFGDSLGLYMQHDGGLVMYVWTGQGWPDVRKTGSQLGLGSQGLKDTEWHHIAGSYDPDVGFALYVDGNLIGTEPAVGPISYGLGGDFRIGSMQGQRVFDGCLDEVQVFEKALTQAEVTSLMQSNPQVDVMDDAVIEEFSADTTCIDYDPIGDGWGWDGSKSCRIDVATVVGEMPCIDYEPIGDGWGWDGSKSCRLDVTVTGEMSCIDYEPIGDGWGWDGTKSCRVELEIDETSFSVNTTTPVVHVASVDEFDLNWGGYPILADIENQRLFLSLGEEYSTVSTLSAPFNYRHSSAGYSVVVAGQSIVAGDDLSVSMQHGDVFTVEIYHGESLHDMYDLIITNLPILQVFASEIQDEPKLPGTMRWVDGERGIDTGIIPLGIEYRGATAQWYDKKPFAFEVRDEEGKGTNLRLLDLRKDDDWIADAAFRDQSFVRNLVSHDIFRDMRGYAYIDDEGKEKGSSTIAGGLAEMILNSSYHGVYVIHERVDRKLLSLKKVDVPEDDYGDRWDLVDFSDLSNGSALYKASTERSDFYYNDSVEREFEQKYPNDDDIARYQPLRDLAKFIGESSDAEFNSQVGTLIDLKSVVDWWMLRLVTSNWDGFKKNYYAARSETLKWTIVPWDFDATFGMHWSGSVDNTSIEFYEPTRNNLVKRLTENPQNGFNAMAKARWRQLRLSLFTEDSIADRFAFYAEQLDKGINQSGKSPRERNLQRWPDTGNTGAGNPELAEVEYIRDWLSRRLIFVDEKMDDLRE